MSTALLVPRLVHWSDLPGLWLSLVDICRCRYLAVIGPIHESSHLRWTANRIHGVVSLLFSCKMLAVQRLVTGFDTHTHTHGRTHASMHRQDAILQGSEANKGKSNMTAVPSASHQIFLSFPSRRCLLMQKPFKTKRRATEEPTHSY